MMFMGGGGRWRGWEMGKCVWVGLGGMEWEGL